MITTLNALVPEASQSLISAATEANRQAHLSRNGTLVVPLYSDRKSSMELFSEEWTDLHPGTDYPGSLTRYRPNFQSSIVHEMYNIPTILQDVSYRLSFQAAEVHARGSYCQIVTDFNGGKLKPFRREGVGRRQEEYRHPTASVFSAAQMGMVRIDLRDQQRLVVRRASVVGGGYRDTALVTHEEICIIDDAYLAAVPVATLPKEAAKWQEAVAACYERLSCTEARCDGHYHHS